MRKILKIFALFTRWSLYRVLAVLTVMVAAEWFFFYRELQEAMTGAARGTHMASLWYVLQFSNVEWISLLGFLSVFLVLLKAGSDKDGKSDYTFYRLGVSHKTVFWCQAAADVLLLLLTLLVQMYAALAMSFYYFKVADAGWVTDQMQFLQMYRSDFLFSLIPMEATGIWVRNLMICVSVGIMSAHYSYSQRRRKFSAMTFIVAFASGWLFYRPVGSWTEVPIWLINGFLTGITLLFVCTSKKEEEE